MADLNTLAGDNLLNSQNSKSTTIQLILSLNANHSKNSIDRSTKYQETLESIYASNYYTVKVG